VRETKNEAKVRLLVEALPGDPEFDLHVEPWGETVRVADGVRAVVTLLGPTDSQAIPTVSVCAAPGHLAVCAEGAIEDYSTEPGQNGQA
jgi:hypothetical protein